MSEAVLETKVGPIGSRNADLMIALGVVGILILLILPLPPLLLDILLVFNLSIALIILFVSIYTNRPVEFSSFPSILLLITLFRLALNVAATRLILLHGDEGERAAGQVIQSIGNFIVEGSYAVGGIIFFILVIINFVVITKGAGRIAEVAARFMLDAMPGKQMSIDADLNAGLIDEKEARLRRKTVSKEADFYGAMDGASKFVRGDAIAAVVIILVNIIGGLVIGVVQEEMGIVEAAQNYTLLTIGEGLVAQIPALIISTASGILVSRAAAEASLGQEVTAQINKHPRALLGASAIIFFFGLIPGLPHLAFLMMALGIGLVGLSARRAIEKTKVQEIAEQEPQEKPSDMGEIVSPLDLMEINVGYGLIPLVDEAKEGNLLKRISGIRKQLALELGFVVPAIHIRDNLQMKPNEYQIIVKGVEVARAEVMPMHFLAMNPSGVDKGISGIPTKEPCFGLDALWLTEQEKERAQIAGYTVVDVPSVIATHLTEIIRSHAHELVGRQEVQQLLDQFSKDSPKVVEELIPNLLPLGGVVKVLGNLLRERIPIRDLRTILETLADYSGSTKDAELLTEFVRQALARTITRMYQTPEKILPVISLDPPLDQKISEAIQQTPQGTFLALDPPRVQRLLNRIAQAMETVSKKGVQAVLLCSPAVRPHLRKLIERFMPSLAVLSSNEVVPQVKIQSMETVRLFDEDKEI